MLGVFTYYQTHDHIAMTVDVLGCTVNNYVCAKLQGLLIYGSHEGVIHHNNRFGVESLGLCAYCFNIMDVKSGICGGLYPNHIGFLIYWHSIVKDEGKAPLRGDSCKVASRTSIDIGD